MACGKREMAIEMKFREHLIVIVMLSLKKELCGSSLYTYSVDIPFTLNDVDPRITWMPQYSGLFLPMTRKRN